VVTVKRQDRVKMNRNVLATQASASFQDRLTVKPKKDHDAMPPTMGSRPRESNANRLNSPGPSAYIISSNKSRQ
jgi:hypothetical protein